MSLTETQWLVAWLRTSKMTSVTVLQSTLTKTMANIYLCKLTILHLFASIHFAYILNFVCLFLATFLCESFSKWQSMETISCVKFRTIYRNIMIIIYRHWNRCHLFTVADKWSFVSNCFTISSVFFLSSSSQYEIQYWSEREITMDEKRRKILAVVFYFNSNL